MSAARAFLSAGAARLVTLLTCCTLGAGWDAAQAREIVVGLFVPPEPVEAASLRQGAQRAVELANRNSEIKVRLAVRGRAGQWGTEGDEAAALALDEEVGGIITPSSGTATHQILQVAGRTRVPVVSLCPDSSITAAGIPWVVRMVPRTDEEARALFMRIADTRKGGQPTAQAERELRLACAAIVPPDRAGREVSRDLMAGAAGTGCRLLEPIRLGAESSDWESRIRQLAAERLSAILIWTDVPTAGKLARHFRQAGFSGLLAGPSRLCSPAFLQAAGEAAEGFLVADMAPDLQKSGMNLAGNQSGADALQADTTAVVTYDATLWLIHLLRTAPEAPFRAFPVRGTLPATTGLLEFDKNGNRLVKLALLVCRHGHFQPLVSDLGSMHKLIQP